MAHFAGTHTHSFSERFLAGAATFAQTVVARYAHYRTYHRSVAELRKLSDRDLKDLGLNRSMIKSVALEAADKKGRM
ncbi:MAG: DUF1127 domain-containing protein [Roseobacter sp.]